ncbi:MAG: hypothetical protein LH615_06880 [Ferruginibacter sp.]|nr:hypothetical protein [Ferruginibacter sp.]
MKKYLFVFFALTWVFISCAERNKTAETTLDNSTAIELSKHASIIEIDNRLQGMDSLVFVFYKDPLGKDSLRYTRFYTQYVTTQSSDVDILKMQIALPTDRFEKVKKCRSEGKVWCFNKGKIFQTLYFSDFGGNCSFMFVIKNGQFFYAALDDDFKKRIHEYKTLSITPAT